MLGKVLALVLVAAAYGLLSLVGSVLVGAITLQARGAEAFPSRRCSAPWCSACSSWGCGP